VLASNHYRAQQKKEREARQVKITTTSSMTMWVDKYRPKQFTDLLGEEVCSCPAWYSSWSDS
jgi:hypothetical protein